MRQTLENGARTTEIARIVEIPKNVTSLQQHLREIIDGAAFRSSHRSRQFLKYVVERAIAGDFSALKERLIGVELFGRSASYDTGEDAIVRVTANDVRKRLLQHYRACGSASEFRISLPAGSYIPEITRDAHYGKRGARNGAITEVFASASETVPSIPPLVPTPLVVAEPAEAPATGRPDNKWLLFAVLFIGLIVAICGIFAKLSPQTRTAPRALLPWAAFFEGQRLTFLVTSDPNIAEIQGLTGSAISVSDYANQQYLPSSNSLSPEIIHFCRDILRGDKAANVDTPIVSSVAQLAQENSANISVRPARDLRFSDLDTENNFIFLGSPRSDPWTALFNDRLDFRFLLDKTSQQEIIQNAHPHSGEAATYISTAKGYGTGESFATISFIGNPDHAGQVLLLAGANAEGTKAAGQLVTNPQALSAALKQCSIRSSTPVQHFQLLLRVNIMAGSPRDFNVVACHLLR
ncbi:MAG TPA: hypothetical protein VGM27_17900 [Acidobacteriaceae bacterium]|jgi:hypothetical protein